MIFLNFFYGSFKKKNIFQLAFQTETQRGGLVFIYNMANSKYSNFDYDLSQKMLTLLKGAYPARLKKVLIVTAPLWFKAPFKVSLQNNVMFVTLWHANVDK